MRLPRHLIRVLLFFMRVLISLSNGRTFSSIALLIKNISTNYFHWSMLSLVRVGSVGNFFRLLRKAIPWKLKLSQKFILKSYSCLLMTRVKQYDF
ncbi:hypothetical protein BK637_21315 [Pseudomonas chlororaphis]|nr:hypothetical protein BK637_21315 [Pseudomonas chlororaphis]